MSSAEYFENVQLDIVLADPKNNVVTFKITGQINYAGRSSGFKVGEDS